jgi:hypothetical protein
MSVLRWTLAMLAISLGAGCVQTLMVVPVSDSIPPTVVDPSTVHTIAMDRVVTQVPRGQKIGSIAAGLLCIPRGTVTVGGGQFNITDANYLKIIYDELANRNYPVSNDPTELFRTSEAHAADFRLGARITDLRVNVCYPLSRGGNLSEGTAEASITMEWQLFDTRSRSIVLKTESRGYGKVSGITENPGIVANDIAVGVATRNMLNDGNFSRYVGNDPARSASATAGNGTSKSP